MTPDKLAGAPVLEARITGDRVGDTPEGASMHEEIQAARRTSSPGTAGSPVTPPETGGEI